MPHLHGRNQALVWCGCRECLKQLSAAIWHEAEGLVAKNALHVRVIGLELL
jgi:hypothetical protein